MNRKKMPCPAERWEHDARQWHAVAKRLARLCATFVGCAFDEEKICPVGQSCTTCWLNRAIRETARKEN